MILNFYRGERGLTLIELLVVIAIIGVLATIATIGARYARAQAQLAKAQQALAEINSAINMLANDADLWPGRQTVNEVGSGSTNEICAVSDGCTYGLSDARAGLVATDGNYSNWSGPYMVNIPLDPWGHEYFFDTDYQINTDLEPSGCGGTLLGNAAVIGSYGPDGAGNNAYNCDDIIKIIVK